MSQYYNPNRQFGLYDPNDNKPFRISRSKIDMPILDCVNIGHKLK